jgi:dihydroorotate dehydrogenase electron transfer subunit
MRISMIISIDARKSGQDNLGDLMIDSIATVERNLESAEGYRLLTLNFNEEFQILPGQFAMLRAHNCYEPLLRRALAVYRQDGPRQLSFLYQVLGRGTEMLSRLNRGAQVDALLPLGNHWPIGECPRAIVVAGGVGSASVLMLCEELKRFRIDTQIFFGAANKRSAFGCGLADFLDLDLPLSITTDDGSLGERALVTAPLERHLSEDESPAVVYACGPWAMMKRVAEISRIREVKCFASLEAPMGCGFGVCVGCVVAVETDEPSAYGSYKRVCTDGSIFPSEMIRWEVAAMSH